MANNAATTRDAILRRMERVATNLGEDLEEWVECPLEPGKRWRVDARWIEFECGCRAERCLVLHGKKNFDPVIFEGLPEQAVYDFVCWKHEAAMNRRMSFSGVPSFKAWHSRRRNRLMGRAL